MAEDVGRGAHLGLAGDEAVDLLAPRRERHRAVEARDPARVELVQLAREADHGAPRERDDDRARPEAGDRLAAAPVERRLPLEEAHLDLRECVAHERQRLDRAEQEDVAVLAAEHEARPRRAALLVLRPLHLVEDERLPAQRRHLGRAADDRRILVDPLFAGHEPDLPLPQLRGQPPVRLLREHPQRRRVDARARSRRGSGARRASCRSSSGRGARSPSRARCAARAGGRSAPRRACARGAAPPMPLAPAGTLLPPPSPSDLEEAADGQPRAGGSEQEPDDDQASAFSENGTARGRRRTCRSRRVRGSSAARASSRARAG